VGFFVKTFLYCLFVIYISGKTPAGCENKEFKRRKEIWSVAQARAKGGGRGVQCIPVSPVRPEVVLHSPTPWWGVRGGPGTCQCYGVWIIGGTLSTELVSRNP